MMGIWIVEHVNVDFSGAKATITVSPPVPSDRKREDIEGLHQVENYRWLSKRIEEILDKKTGSLTDADHPMRCPGAGVLPLITLDGKRRAILHVRGSNRGAVWPIQRPLHHAFCWKEFAGLCNINNLAPDQIARKELHEELTLFSEDAILKQRATPVHGTDPTCLIEIRGDPNTRIVWESREIESIISYDPSTNALESSFVGEITTNSVVTGVVSFAGPEDQAPLFLEDLILVDEEVLRRARVGDELSVKHLLSVHGSNNLKQSPLTLTNLFYNPAPTLAPIVSFINGEYGFEAMLREALKKIERRVRSDIKTITKS
ncbi:MAG: hypothetical protein ACRD5H_12995 [Nitrososphaerales archaeon]